MKPTVFLLFLLWAAGLVCQSCRTVQRSGTVTREMADGSHTFHRDSISVATLTSLAKKRNQRLIITLEELKVTRDSSGTEVEETRRLTMEATEEESTDSCTTEKGEKVSEEENDSTHTEVAEEAHETKKSPPGRRWLVVIVLAIMAPAIVKCLHRIN